MRICRPLRVNGGNLQYRYRSGIRQTLSDRLKWNVGAVPILELRQSEIMNELLETSGS